MKKKIISMVMCLGMLLFGMQSFAAQPVTVELDCVQVSFDQAPQIINDRTMVPVRAIFEALGATVDWNGETKTVTSTLEGTTVVMTIDSPVMTVNNAEKTLDAAPLIHGGRTLVPVRAVSEGFGCTVEWIAEERLVRIRSKKFLRKIASAEQFSSVKALTSETNSGTVAFGLTYFDGYDVKTHSADGTDIEISTTTDTGHAYLNVRTDLYVGEDKPITEEYTKDVAEGLVSVLSGTLVSTGVTSFGGVDFMEIKYTTPGIVAGITDFEPDITLYMGRKNGVVYTLTYGVYGEVPSAVIGDFCYMIDSLIIV